MKKNNIFNKFNQSVKLKLFIIYSITTLVLTLTPLYFYNQSPFPLYYKIVPIISTLFCLIIIIFNLINISKLNTAFEKITELELYNKSLDALYNNIRSFKHDFANILTAIGGYIYTQDIQGLEQYHSKILAEYNINNNLAYLNPKLINNPAIYNILAQKYYIATEKNIKFVMQIFIDFKKLCMNIFDFTRILSILLDNAIEATENCNSKIINLEIMDSPMHKYQILSIENTFSNPNLDLTKLSDKNYTTKTNNKHTHGYGLWQVSKILKKNEYAILNTTVEGNLFKQELIIYYKKQI